jgi:RNA polymerase sigma-70 factor (ECF subfamily)
MITLQQQQEFQTLVDLHKKILYKICNSYCRNRGDREDLAQEIVVQLWRSFGMYRIGLNVAISFYRKETARTRYILSDDGQLLNAINETTYQSSEIQALHQFIATLDPLDKALALLYLDGNSYLEIANVLGISETNVATKISRMKQRMRHELSGSAQS